MYSFRPDPEPLEREALLAALDRLLADEEPQPSGYRSRWRQAAFEEGVSSGDDEADLTEA